MLFILISSHSSLFSKMTRFPIIRIYVRRMWCVAAIVRNEAPSLALCAPSDCAIDPLSQSSLHLHPPVRLMQSYGIVVLISVVCHRRAIVVNDCQIVFCVESHHALAQARESSLFYRRNALSRRYYSADAVITRLLPLLIMFPNSCCSLA